MGKRMARRISLILAVLLIFSVSLPASVRAQDGLNLPADLYVLLNDGQIQRYGMGATGVTNLTPPGIFIVDFGVDSRGERLAFRTESGLFVINIGSGGDTQQIEGASADVPAYRGAGDSIAWSPEGDALAYTTTYGARIYFVGGTFVDLREGVFKNLSWSPGGRFLAAETDSPDGVGGIWWIYRRDGAAMTLTSVITSSMGAAWVSDSELVFAPVAGGLRLMNLDQANAQVELLGAAVNYRLPDITADGALVFFGRDPNDAALPDGYGRLLRLARGAQQVETVGQVPVALNGLRWAPGGSLLVAYQGGVIALYDPSTGLGFPLPMTDVVAYDWGPVGQPAAQAQPTLTTDNQPTLAPSATEAPANQATNTPVPPTPAPVSTVNALTLATDSFFLAPDARGIIQVWRLPSNGTPALVFTGSGSDVNEFAASPDSERVVYVVEAELWLQQRGLQPAMMARLNSFAPVEADFSSDSASITYVDERSGVWVNVIEEDAPQVVLANDTGNGGVTYHRPQFSPDGSRILLDVYGSGGVAMGVLDVGTREVVELLPAAPDDPRPTRAHWLRDGRIYSIVDASTPSAVAPGIYIFDADAPDSTPEWFALPADVTVRSSVEAVGGVLRVLLARGERGADAFAPLSAVDYDLSNGEASPILDIGAVIAPQLSPDGRFVGGYESLTLIDGVQQGALLVVDLQSGRRYLLSNPPSAWGFRWTAP